MPIYQFKHPKTNKIYDVMRSFAQSSDPYVAPDGVVCEKVISAPAIRIGDAQPDRYERKEKAHMEKVKDPDRARRLRKQKFGTEGISITKSPYYKKDKRVKAQGNNDVDKKTFIKHAAQNPNALAAAKKALRKN
jgi:predicted nucleic acid-binding Zn ribbon protein